MSSKDIADIKSWMKNHLDSFYLYSHGNVVVSPNGSGLRAEWGTIRFYSYAFGAPGKENQISVPSTIGVRRYRFACIDTCYSAGGNHANGNIGTLMLNFASAFNVLPNEFSDVLFLGWNGVSGSNTMVYGEVPSPWYTWRKNLWDKLVKQNYTMYDALGFANSQYQGDPNNISPLDISSNGTPRRTTLGDVVTFRLY